MRSNTIKNSIANIVGKSAMKQMIQLFMIMLGLTLALIPNSVFASKQARGYGHAFDKGNFISNWSFESVGQTWDQNAKVSGFTVDPRFKMSNLGGTNKATSGVFVGKITGTATSTNAGGNFSFYTPYLPIRSTVMSYTLSMYVRASGVVGTVNPSIRLYREKDNPASLISSVQGNAYTNNSEWTLYEWTFYAGQEQNYFQLALSETYTAGHGGTFYFDDIVLQEWYSASPRNTIQENVVYADALGRSFQSQSVLAGNKVTPYPGWSNSAQITINTTASGANIRDNLSGFPLLVRLTSTNFNFSEAKANGEDIRFSDAEGNQIQHEIEFWSASSNVAAIWVKVPILEGNKADNIIFMHWGNSSVTNASNPTGVFDEYAGSYLNYHMGEIPTGTNQIVNASNPIRNAIPEGMTAQNQVAGKIGYNLDFNDNFSQFLDNSIHETPPISSKSFTFSAWVKLRPQSPNTTMNIVQVYRSSDCSEVEYLITLEGNRLTLSGRGGFNGRWQSSTTLTADYATYYHVAVTFQKESVSSVPTVFVNGQSTQLSSANQPSSYEVPNFNWTIIGNTCLDGQEGPGFHGTIDELRIENALRSVDWIKMEYEVEKSGSPVVNINRNIHADQPTKLQSSGMTYDKFGRPDRSYLPCRTTAGDLTDPTTCAQDPEMPNMGGYNYAQGVYAQEPGDRALEMGFAGTNNRVGSGHTAKSDYYYVSSLSIPTNIETPPTATAADTVYNLSWSKDPDGNYSLQWSNRKGQSVQSAQNVNKAGATPNLWQWSISKFDYYRDGSLKRTRTPLDVSAGNTNFSVVPAVNTLGQLSSQYSPDRGLVKHWYNRSGNIRFTQDAGQRTGSGYTYFDYDNQGRLIAKGPQAITGTMDQTLADQDAYVGGTKNEKIGYIYDDLSTFQARTGLTLATVMPDAYANKSDFLESRHGFGRMICKYNRNTDNTLPGLSNASKFVAEFFVYNRAGNVERVFKYFGPIRTVDQRFQEAAYYYDDATGQLMSETIYANALNGSVSMYYGYEYDEKGRVKNVKSNYGSTPIVEFSYMSWGPVKSILLGGDGSGVKGTKVEYTYHTSGGIQEIRATQMGTGKILFQQFLGYDGKANADAKVPATTAKYSGTITQQLYKFADDVNSLRPVRLVNYNFDELGRMLSADYQRNTGSNPLNTNGSINFAAFNFENVTQNDSYMGYDLNGRITSQSTGGQSPAGVYNYQSNSYKLNNVSGPVSSGSSRNMPAGFVYSSRGAMTNDRTKDLLIAYDWNLMPVKFTKNSTVSPSSYQEQYCFYDADGQRVVGIQMEVSGGVRNWFHGKHYITLNGRPYKEWEERYAGTTPSIDYTSETHNLLGTSVVGRWNRGTTEYFLMNHQGSVMMTVDENGNEPDKGRVVNDYLAYGDRRKLKDNGDAERITPNFTGKEYEDLYGLYYFGARWYDAELGLWLSPDPAHDGVNPYGYVGGDPTNFIDPFGLFKIGLGITIGYDSKRGFNIGLGVAADDIDLGVVQLNTDISTSWAQKGGQVSTASVGGGADIGVVGVSGQAGVSHNHRSGNNTVFGSVSGAAFGGGVEAGGTGYFDRGWDYQGATAYGRGFGGTNSANAGGGYEWGFGGVKGRGAFVDAKAFGFSAGYAQNGGLTYGVTQRVDAADAVGAVWGATALIASQVKYGEGYIEIGSDGGIDVVTRLDLGGAITFGNIRTYTGGMSDEGFSIGPRDNSRSYFPQIISRVNMGKHEMRHTAQYREMGNLRFLHDYMFQDSRQRLELDADIHGWH
jgi:RHS repeat-associated protein